MGLLNLSYELISQISDDIDPDDLLSWRLTCTTVLSGATHAQEIYASLLKYRELGIRVRNHDNDGSFD